MWKYEINVAKQTGRVILGRAQAVHYCRINAGEYEEHAREVFGEVRKRFPKAEGFEVTISRSKTVGEFLPEWENIISSFGPSKDAKPLGELFKGDE